MSEVIAEKDPSGRYVRYKNVLGTGAFKTVYKAFDTEDALEVAWNKLEVERFTERELKDVHKEVELLQKIQHRNIIHFYSSWRGVSPEGHKTLDFITELMMSGTLKEYLKKAKAIKLKVLRRWCSNILDAIAYLHSQSPPIMHRDIKCDNIFINGHLGEVKIGDLGLSSIRKREKAYSVIGTPEFMAPEIYDESYTEKVDVYAFGMCMLELVTMEYPYSECKNPAQIFKKVFSEEKPHAFSKLVDGPVKDVIAACLSGEPARPSAAELLKHPLFRDWEKDDGRLSNLSLVCGTTESQERLAASDHRPNSFGNWGIGVTMIDHSEALHRDMFISKEAAPEHGGAELEVVASHEGGGFRIGLQIPLDDAVKRVEFSFDPNHDSVPQLAQELVSEFNLPSAQLGIIRMEIENQVLEAKRRRGLSLAARREKSNPGGTVPSKHIPDPALKEGQFESTDISSRKVAHSNIRQTVEAPVSASLPVAARSGATVQRQTGIPVASVGEKPRIVVVKSTKEKDSNVAQKTTGVTNIPRKDFSAPDKASTLEVTVGAEGPLETMSSTQASSKKRVPTVVKTEVSANDASESQADYRKPGDFVYDQKHFSLCIELMEHCAKGRYTLAMQKLDKGASPTFADYDKRTPLHLAAAEGHAAICDLLLKRGAQMGVKDRWGRTPLDDAIANKAEDVIPIFEQYGGKNAYNQPSKDIISTEMMQFAAKGLLNRVREKLVAGASARFANYDLRTPLHVACAEGHVEVAELLLLNGALPDKKDRYDRTPVDDAIRNGHRGVLRVLRQYGGSVPEHVLDSKFDRCYQLGLDLMEHAAKGRTGSVRQCIQNGANVNFRDFDKRTPLHLACGESHLDVVDVLIKAGADPSLKDRWGSTPEEDAKRNGHQNVVELLNRHALRRVDEQDREVLDYSNANHKGKPLTKATSVERESDLAPDYMRRLQEEIRRGISMDSLRGMAHTDTFAERYPPVSKVPNSTSSISVNGKAETPEEVHVDELGERVDEETLDQKFAEEITRVKEKYRLARQKLQTGKVPADTRRPPVLPPSPPVLVGTGDSKIPSIIPAGPSGRNTQQKLSETDRILSASEPVSRTENRKDSDEHPAVSRESDESITSYSSLRVDTSLSSVDGRVSTVAEGSSQSEKLEHRLPRPSLAHERNEETQRKRSSPTLPSPHTVGRSGVDDTQVPKSPSSTLPPEFQGGSQSLSSDVELKGSHEDYIATTKGKEQLVFGKETGSDGTSGLPGEDGNLAQRFDSNAGTTDKFPEISKTTDNVELNGASPGRHGGRARSTGLELRDDGARSGARLQAATEIPMPEAESSAAEPLRKNVPSRPAFIGPLDNSKRPSSKTSVTESSVSEGC